MRILYRILLSTDAISLYFFVYCLKEEYALPIEFPLKFHITCIICIVLIILFSVFCLFLSRFLGNETIDGGILEIETANNSYLPSYLGYFFVALSVQNINALIWIGVIIFIFSYFSQIPYFNPLFLLFGYNFYSVKVETGMNIFVITRRKITGVNNLKFTNLKRVNDFTFIDKEK